MTGVGDFAAKLNAMSARVHKAAPAGLLDWAEHVLEQSSRVVPLEESTLQNSGTTAVDVGALVAAVGYGRGAAAAYAVKQHEKPMKHDPGRKDHYLSDTVAQTAGQAEKIVAGPIRSVLG